MFLMKMYIEQEINKARYLEKKGEIVKAKNIYNRILKVFPKNLRVKKKLAELDISEKNNSVHPPHEVINRLIKLFNQKKFSFVVDQAHVVTRKYPNAVIVWNILGISAAQLGMLEESINAFNKSLVIEPNAETFNNLGNVLKDQNNTDKAIEAYKKAIILKPNFAAAYYNIGSLFAKQDKFDQAIKAYKNSIFINPDYAEAYCNLGIAFKNIGKFSKAIEAYKKSISIKSDIPLTHNNMGVTLHDLGKFEESIQFFKKAIEINPNFATAHHNLSYTFLSCGMLKEGFNEYEWRWQAPKFTSQQRSFTYPIWDGKTTLKDKTILLWCEQGIGDTMNWSSCLSLVTSCAKHVILECQEKLVPLLSRSFPHVEVKAEDRSLDTERDDFDLHLPMGSLYKHFIDEIIENGKASSYLVPDPDRVKFWKERLHSVGRGPYVGVCWKSSVKSAYRLQHYPPMSDWSPVFKVTDVTFINLQYTDYEDDIAKVQDELGVTIHNLEGIDQYGDIDEVAALCCALDMVVSTKVTPPMISAGVGTPTKIANWRQSTYNTILTNPQSTSLRMIHRDTWEPWDNVFRLITKDIVKLKNKATYSKDKL
jgi:tetratricopeptide (TPR) repeat protein